MKFEGTLEERRVQALEHIASSIRALASVAIFALSGGFAWYVFDVVLNALSRVPK